MDTKNNALGVLLAFEGDVLDNGDTIAFKGSRPGKAEALAIGWRYYEADDIERDEMLVEFGGRLLRRSLMAFSNYAARTAQPEVKAYALMLRDEITLGHGDQSATQKASVS